MIIKNKYIKFVFALVCAFLISDKISAKEITCRYDINSTDIPYQSVTVAFSSDGSPLETSTIQGGTYTFDMYYQFDNGVKNKLYSVFASGISTNKEVCLFEEGNVGCGNVATFIPVNEWVTNGCFESIDIIYSQDKSSWGFSKSATAEQAKWYGNSSGSKKLELKYNSEKGNVYTVRISANESSYYKVYNVYSGELVPEPTGFPAIEDGKKLCWQTQEAHCWDFNSPVTSDLILNAVYLDNVGSGAGFVGDIDKMYATCNGVDIPYGVPYIIHNIINLIQIVTPIILIVLGMLDFGKAVVANDEKKMKDASSKFIRRAIAAVIIFFVIAIVKFVFGQVLSDDKGALGCIDCFINNDCDTHE